MLARPLLQTVGLLAAAGLSAAQLNIQQASADDAAHALFGSSYSVSDVSSTGNAAQYGTFSGGNAVSFGIDSGIVLSSGSLLGTNDNEAGNTDPRIDGSRDVADLIATVQALPSNTQQFSVLSAIFCTCENANSADSFPERGQIYVDNVLSYNKQKGPEDTRPTSPFGFAVGDNVAFGGGPCKCSEPEPLTLVRPQQPTKFEVLVADIGDGAFNSWLFLGFLGNTNNPTPPQIIETVTTTQVATQTESVSVTETQSTVVATQTSTVPEVSTVTAVVATSTAPYKATRTQTVPTATVTVKSSKCTQYILHFKEDSCPRRDCRKKITPRGLVYERADGDGVLTVTNTVESTTLETATVTVTDVVSETATETATLTSTETVPSTAVTTPCKTVATVFATATQTACKQVNARFHCPANARTDAQKKAAARKYVQEYNQKRRKGDPALEIRCDGDKTVYSYP